MHAVCIMFWLEGLHCFPWSPLCSELVQLSSLSSSLSVPVELLCDPRLRLRMELPSVSSDENVLEEGIELVADFVDSGFAAFGGESDFESLDASFGVFSSVVVSGSLRALSDELDWSESMKSPSS